MEIGKLEKVELRDLWNGEATDFTPWLAESDNIDILGKKIGIELEVQEQEKSVGPFKADILCKDTVTDNFVLIENQLERTDHTHLGQLMTYAAGLDAVTIIWIAKTFSEEHRAAVDWLNSITDDKINFFGIEIEVYRIDNSRPAPMFNIIAKPNDWTKSIKSATASTEITETKRLQLEYWEAMKKYFEASGTFLRCQKPSPQHWTNFSLGKSNIHLSAICSVKDDFNRIDLNIGTPDAKEIFHKLKNKFGEEANQHFENMLEWNENLEAKVSIINLKKDARVSSRSLWEEQHDWFKENLEKFDKYFRPKLKNI